MKNAIILLAASLYITLNSITAFAKPAPLPYKDKNLSVESRVDDLIKRMTLEEKVAQLIQSTAGNNTNPNNLGASPKLLDGKVGSILTFIDDPAIRNSIQKQAIENTRLSIPIIFGYDVIHGYRTTYPIPLAQACSFNPGLVSKACAIAAEEASTVGIDWTFAPMIDVARDPRWGRVAEGYGEDPYVNGVFAAASVRGFQGTDLTAKNTIAACLKHYVGYAASEGGRDYQYTEISRQTLWDVYLPPFKAGVEAGACTLMSGFNDISGIPVSANHYTLTEVLRGKWGFDGFVVSDWNSIAQLINQGYASDQADAGKKALEAGVDMDMVDDCYIGHLERLVNENAIPIATVNTAVKRILRIKFRLGLFDRPYTDVVPEKKRFLKEQYLRTVEELAAESMVLLKNHNNILPLDKNIKSIAVIGPLADAKADMLGSWKTAGKAEDAQSILDGLRKKLPKSCKINYAKGCEINDHSTDGFDKAAKAARASEVVILCVGESANMSGENTSQTQIKLPGRQQQLIERIRSIGKPVILVLSNGRPLELAQTEPHVDAILEIWQPGLRGGTPVADILFGDRNPSGKLAMTFPRAAGQIPVYYSMRQGGRKASYRDNTTEPMYWFGHGLSYSNFQYSSVKLNDNIFEKGQKITAEVTVTNTSNTPGKETLFWYITDHAASVTQPIKKLISFEKRLIPAGKTITFKLDIDPKRHLGFYDRDGNRIVENGRFTIHAGTDSSEQFYLGVPPSVKPDAKGHLLLTAGDAMLNGSLSLETKGQTSNIGYWSKQTDTASWFASLKKGTYEIEIEYCAPEQIAGTEFAIVIGDKQVKATTKSTGQKWDEFKQFKVGSVKSDSPETIVVIVKAIGPIKGSLMNLKSVKLTKK